MDAPQNWQDTQELSPAFIEAMLLWQQQMNNQQIAWAKEWEKQRQSFFPSSGTSPRPKTPKTTAVPGPSKTAPAPAQKMAEPVQEVAKPAQKVSRSAQLAAEPAQEVVKPAQEATPRASSKPAQEAAPKLVAKPVQETAKPAQGVARPIWPSRKTSCQGSSKSPISYTKLHIKSVKAVKGQIIGTLSVTTEKRKLGNSRPLIPRVCTKSL